MNIFVLLIGFVSLAGPAARQPVQVPEHFQKVAQIVGKPGSLNADGSFRINIPREGEGFANQNGMSINPDMGLATYLAMSGTAQKVLAVGDIALLSNEIDLVIDALRKGKFEVVALHNHMTGELPKLFFLHFQVIGKPEEIAQTFRSAVNVLGNGAKPEPASEADKPKIDSDAISKILGVKAEVKPSGVVRYSNPRKDLTVTVDGESFTAGMGLGSWATFSACACGKTMAMGDTCCTREELQNAIDALRKAGMHITAIHNHVFGSNQQIAFMHYEGEGDSLQMAAGIKECWQALGKKS